MLCWIDTFVASARLRETQANTLPKKSETTPETTSEEQSLGVMENAERGLAQAPNRREIWSRSQQPRAKAMSGPRFEQTDFDLQVRNNHGWTDIQTQLSTGALIFWIASIESRY